MNDYEMMNQRVDQLRIQLADVAKEQLILDRSKEAIMAELLDTRRQITRADKQRVKLGFFVERCPNRAFFDKELAEAMASISKDNSEPVVTQTGHTYSAVWVGHPIRELAPVDYLDV